MMSNNHSTMNNPPSNAEPVFDLDVNDYIIEDDLMEMVIENQPPSSPSSSKGMEGLNPEIAAFISGFDCEKMEDLKSTVNNSNKEVAAAVVPEQHLAVEPPEESGVSPLQQLAIAASEETVAAQQQKLMVALPEEAVAPEKKLHVVHQSQAMVPQQQLEVAHTEPGTTIIESPTITSTSTERGSWFAHSRQRTSGKYVGKIDWYYYHSETDYIFRSMVSLKRFIETQELPKPKTKKIKSDHDVTSLPTYEKGEPSKSSAARKGKSKSSQSLAPNVKGHVSKSSAPPKKGQSSQGLAPHRKGSVSQETLKRKKSNLSLDHVNQQEKVKWVLIDAKAEPWIPLVVKKREPIWHAKTSAPPEGDVEMKNKSSESSPVAPSDVPDAADLESPPVAPSDAPDASDINDQLMEVPVHFQPDFFRKK